MSLKPSNFHGRLILNYYLTYPIVIKKKKKKTWHLSLKLTSRRTSNSHKQIYTPWPHTLTQTHTLVHNCVVQSCNVFPLSKHLLWNHLQIADCSVCWLPKGIEQSTQRQADETVAHTVSSSGKLNLPSGAGFHISLLF